MSKFCSNFAVVSLLLLANSVGVHTLVGQQPKDVLKQEVDALIANLQKADHPDAIFKFLSTLKLHGRGAKEAIPEIVSILREPRHSAKQWFFPPLSVHGNALEVLEAIGPESMNTITSLLEESSLTDNLTGHLLATAIRIAEESDRRFPETALQIERLVRELGDSTEDREHLLTMAVSAFAELAEPNSNSLDFIFSIMAEEPEEHYWLQYQLIGAVGRLGVRSPKALAILSERFSKTKDTDNYYLPAIITSYGQVGLRDGQIESFLLNEVNESPSPMWRASCSHALVGVPETATIGIETLCSELRRIIDAETVSPLDFQVGSWIFTHLRETRIDLVRNCEPLLIEAVLSDELRSLRFQAFELLVQIDSTRLIEIAKRLSFSSDLGIRMIAMDYLSEKNWLDFDSLEAVHEGLVNNMVHAVRVLGRLKGRAVIYLDDLEIIWLDQSLSTELRLEAFAAIEQIKDDMMPICSDCRGGIPVSGIGEFAALVSVASD